MDELKKEAVAVGVVAFVSFCAGGGLAYYLTKRHERLRYEEIMADEMAKAREFYANVYKTDYPTPEAAAKALNVEVPRDVKEAADALRSYNYSGNVTVKKEDLEDPGSIIQFEEEPLEKNIFENGDQLVIDKADRSADKPYVVDLDEYMENPGQYDQISLTYYSGDNVLADDEDKPIDDVNRVVGRMNLNMFGASDPENPHVVLIRNEKLRSDYEITHSDGKFAHLVLGFEHSNEVRSRRGRPRWDDE